MLTNHFQLDKSFSHEMYKHLGDRKEIYCAKHTFRQCVNDLCCFVNVRLAVKIQLLEAKETHHELL